VDDTFKSIKAFLYDRAASPLMGAFIISWITWNYKAVVILFSSEKFQTKFYYINDLYPKVEIELINMQLPINHFMDGLLVPSIMTYIYIYLYPYIAEPVYVHSLKKQIALKKIKQATEKQKLLSVEESNKMHIEFLNLEIKFESDTKRYRDQIKALQSKVEDIKTEKEVKEILSKDIEKKDDYKKQTKLTDQEYDILEQFENKSESFTLTSSTLKAQMPLQPDEVDVSVQNLKENKYLDSKYDARIQSFKHFITLPGKKYLIEHQKAII